MNDSRNEDPLRDLLLAGDPAADGAEPDREELAGFRRRVLARVSERRSFASWLPAAVATGAMIAIAIAVTVLRPEPVVQKRPTMVESPAGSAAEAPGSRQRQIQFATDKGTRIIWVLDPDLAL